MDLWTTQLEWHDSLSDPSGRRRKKPRKKGRTMIIDKGLGVHAFEDLVHTAGEHIDIIKLGFGTAALYPMNILQQKIALAKSHRIEMMPGGTFLEVAVRKGEADEMLYTAAEIGFNSIEVSDGTIEMSRALRNELIRKGKHYGLTVYTEYGKKISGSKIEANELIETMKQDLDCGSSMITIEARESGAGVGLFDAEGRCHEDQIYEIVNRVEDPSVIMWETPRKEQQIFFLKTLGGEINLGNIAPDDAIALEALRRGLRSDTLELQPKF